MGVRMWYAPSMRWILTLSLLPLAACASTPGANEHVAQPLAQLHAQQRELASMEARVQQLRTRIDLKDSADADDVNALLAAQDDLRRLRAHMPGVDSGYNDLGWHPLEALGTGAWQTGGRVPTGPGGINGAAAPRLETGRLGLFSAHGRP